MCYACSSCGLCKPKRVISIMCPACGAPHTLKREEFLLLFDLPHRLNVLEKHMLERGGVPDPVCSVCGTTLTETFDAAVTPRPCKSSGIVCGYPCGRSEEEPDADAAPCPFQVPLGKI